MRAFGTIMATMREALIFELVSGLPRPDLRAAALNHEARNHAVKDQAIAKPLEARFRKLAQVTGVSLAKSEISMALAGSVESDLDVIHGSL